MLTAIRRASSRVPPPRLRSFAPRGHQNRLVCDRGHVVPRGLVPVEVRQNGEICHDDPYAIASRSVQGDYAGPLVQAGHEIQPTAVPLVRGRELRHRLALSRADQAGLFPSVRLLDRPGRREAAWAHRCLADAMTSGHEKCCHDASKPIKQLLRRFIAVDLSGFYPQAADQEHPFQGSLNRLICSDLFGG